MKKYTLYFLLLILCNSCVEEIDLQSFESTQLLIIEAELTNELKHHTVKLSRAIPLDSISIELEPNAIVNIEDNNNNSFSFSETTPGIYTSEIEFKAELSNSYVLNIQTSSGEVYKSNPEKITGVNEIDKIVAVPDTNVSGDLGVRIIVNSNSIDKDAKYYRYTYEETYKIIPPFWSSFKLIVIKDSSPYEVVRVDDPQANERKICYNTIYSNSLIQTETNSLSENSLEYPVRFIEQNNSIIWRRYSILVNQHVQSYEAYTYFKTLEKLSTSDNVFSQVQTGFFQGNLFSVNDSSKKSIGFFEVTSVSKKRIFFNFIDLFPKHDIVFTKDCFLSAPWLNDPDEGGANSSPLINAMRIENLVYARENTNPILELYPGPFKITTRNCTDCRYSGTNVKPDFWID